MSEIKGEGIVVYSDVCLRYRVREILCGDLCLRYRVRELLCTVMCVRDKGKRNCCVHYCVSQVKGEGIVVYNDVCLK